MKYKPVPWPVVSRNPADIQRLFGPESAELQRSIRTLLKIDAPVLGCDLEYHEPERYVEVPTILGVSDGALTVSVPFYDGLPYFKDLLARFPNMRFLGHAFTSADFFAFRQAGIDLKVENIEDTIIRHALVNAHLCKGAKSGEDDEGPSKGKGYMNLWTFLSIYTPYANYKACIGEENGCDGQRPCRFHNEYAYNGVDSAAPVVAFPNILKSSIVRGVEKLYPLHRELAYVLGEMARYGVQADREYLYGEGGLQREFERQKEHIEDILPFNPKSNKAALEHFKKKGIVLEDWQETTIREACEEYVDDELHLCLDHKELGNGVSRWYAPITKDKSGNWKGYMDAYGKIHPRLGQFTSTGRLNCVSPNLQNVSARRMDRHNCDCGHKVEQHADGKKCGECGCEKFSGISVGKLVRRGVIASPGYYLLESDFSNAENRNFLHQAGHAIPLGVDGHTQTAEFMGLTPDMEFVKVTGGGKTRQAAKSAVHGSFYLEGIQLKLPREITGKVQKEIDIGAREIWPEWKFNGKIVTFTGSNLAQRAFGNKTYESRVKALEVLRKLFTAYPGARTLQRRIGEMIERQGAVVTPHGYYLISLGEDEDRMKTGAAMFGSNPIAHLTKLALVEGWREMQRGRPMRPILQVHDSIIWEVRKDVEPERAARWSDALMARETPEIPGMVIPVEHKASLPTDGSPSNWRDMKAVKI